MKFPLKRLTLIVLLLSYTISTLGVGIKEFYCCGTLKSVDISYSADDNESCLKGDKTGGCCETSHHFFKVKDSHYGSGAIDSPVLSFVDLLPVIPAFEAILAVPVFLTYDSRPHAPPILYKAPIYILHCVYRV